MNYFIAVTTLYFHTVSHKQQSQKTEYLRAFNFEDASRLSSEINHMQSIHRDRGLEMSRSADVVTLVRDAKGRGFYLTMEDLNRIVTDFTMTIDEDRAALLEAISRDARNASAYDEDNQA